MDELSRLMNQVTELLAENDRLKLQLFNCIGGPHTGHQYTHGITGVVTYCCPAHQDGYAWLDEVRRENERLTGDLAGAREKLLGSCDVINDARIQFEIVHASRAGLRRENERLKEQLANVKGAADDALSELTECPDYETAMVSASKLCGTLQFISSHAALAAETREGQASVSGVAETQGEKP